MPTARTQVFGRWTTAVAPPPADALIRTPAGLESGIVRV